MTEQPDLFWGIIVSMWVGNLMLLVLNLPLVGLWVRMILVPYRYLFPIILAFSAIGVFSVSNSTFDVMLMAGFGVVGYFFRKLDCEPAPLILAFILGPMIEEYLRRALLLADGNPAVFVQRPLSLALLILAALLLAAILLPSVRKTREAAFEEEA
jgi:TctA family transporter